MPMVNMDGSKLEEMMWESRKLNDLLQDKAQEINEGAAIVFIAEELKNNEFRVSETTPPKYLLSFSTRRKLLNNGRYAWLAYNDDPAAVWVETGAHAGGKNFVLKYRPYGRALDILRFK